jgi:hypothetical protein
VLAEIPALQQGHAFEREILNARIFFIYYVTIQKPTSLPKGWVPYRNAAFILLNFKALLATDPELPSLPCAAPTTQPDTLREIIKHLTVFIDGRTSNLQADSWYWN